MKRLLLPLVMAALLVPLALADKPEPEPLVIYHIGTVPVKMRMGDEYGVMLINDGGEEDPTPRYILGMAKSRTVVDTKDLRLFKNMLKRIPKGAEVYDYDSCTVSRSWGLTEDQRRAFWDVLDEVGLEVDEENSRITCYCKP